MGTIRPEFLTSLQTPISEIVPFSPETRNKALHKQILELTTVMKHKPALFREEEEWVGIIIWPRVGSILVIGLLVAPEVRGSLCDIVEGPH